MRLRLFPQQSRSITQFESTLWFRGGNDSTVAAHLAVRFGRGVDALVHINTGIGIPETGQYVRSFAQWLEMPLIEKYPPREYEDLVMQYGFPGPAAHRYMYSWLKERALREVRREAQEGKRRRVLFITGVRTTESRRRMGHVESVNRDGNIVWVAPIKDFEHRDIWAYRDEFALPRNEVVDFLHMSGECLCGAFSKPNELEWISLWYPGSRRSYPPAREDGRRGRPEELPMGSSEQQIAQDGLPVLYASDCVADDTTPIEITVG